jgi:CheY-like chemotaxis protein
VLLVEDEPAILRLGTAMLKKLGYTVLAAETPADAIRIAQSHPGAIDLLITDVVMPAMDGRELAAQLHAIRPNLPCLFMSGYTADVIAHRGILYEGLQHLQKPFSSQDLAAKLREMFAARRPDLS